MTIYYTTQHTFVTHGGENTPGWWLLASHYEVYVVMKGNKKNRESGYGSLSIDGLWMDCFAAGSSM